MGALTDPRLSLYDAGGALIAANDNWQAADAATSAEVGAFPLASGSTDAVIVATLAPGAYTAQLLGSEFDRNLALLEVYDVSGPARLTTLTTRARVGPGVGALTCNLRSLRAARVNFSSAQPAPP